MHVYFMQQALALAEQARFHAPPNPWVGCVIVKGNQIIGRGYTQPPGQAHAEVKALLEAKEQARGAALYATLEPCSHFGRTPPCVNAIIQAGIKEVYIAQQDPDSRVSGAGIECLRKAGIHVLTGICEQEARAALSSYLHHRRTGLPYTVIKAAMSLDGRTAAADGTSQWITSLEARQDAHLQRAHSQAIIIGSGTALKDKPQLTVRLPSLSLPRQPLRVLLDAKGKTPAEGPLFDCSLAPTLVMTTEQAPMRRREEWERAGAEVMRLSEQKGRINLTDAWKILGKKGILQALVEGGSTLQSALIEAKLLNRLVLYMGPILLGSNGLPLFLNSIPTLQKAPSFKLLSVASLGDCVRADYEPYSI
ncbi:bifunctional diaminohydroxyphosphoribosylaminopyrimidine deaminase/5-amino-6-(5-phosphoribosylamino)uracil reductase RibD [Candidatus Protochlamydia phocaeensis]|uniref:bifunctional diaminohydroxyphosphoribosylaminopyrimidine deaminase/5-amino-6-(5-phosphoribosylamino)uracil reductase RibD n=1 Tax=Candidatus Protochlamydia phocaeensis TaxID=1414722 RepID=UPI000A705E00|nr:bifunctional diaminohydroxyphosphoribosylaminopyrimidine deaminase/5-amino-6-(5-phosphoribosylamino)uracil reductase RibD [Candidatus Protochlamydia phocaeensis]